MTLVKCTSCDELLSKPVFIKGLPYGTSCAKKQSEKGTKAKQVCHSFEVISVCSFLGSKLDFSEIKSELIHTYSFIIMFEGKKYYVYSAKAFIDGRVIVSESFHDKRNTIGRSHMLYNAVYA